MDLWGAFSEQKPFSLPGRWPFFLMSPIFAGQEKEVPQKPLCSGSCRGSQFAKRVGRGSRTSCVVDIHVMGCLGLSIFVPFLGFNKILMYFLSNNHVKQP